MEIKERIESTSDHYWIPEKTVAKIYKQAFSDGRSCSDYRVAEVIEESLDAIIFPESRLKSIKTYLKNLIWK